MIRKKRMSKGIAKILSGLLVFGMVAGLVPAVPGGTVHAKAAEISGQNVTTEPHTHCVCGTGNLSVEGHTHKEETWTGISKLSDINREGNYYLTQDVTLTSAWTCQRNVNLCLNGHSITRTAKGYYDQNGNNAVIIIKSNVDFTLTDCKGTGTITHQEGVSGEGVYNDGRFFMYNGIISGNNGGVKNPGMFFMYGGRITSNHADNGGGVCNDAGIFTMYGGTITSNTADNGGGVYNNNPGKFFMYGGTITTNNAGSGGGVYVSVNCSFDMYGGTITGNNTNSGGGGVYNNAGRFTMSGGKINNNTSNKGGGVYYISTVPFKMSGTAEIIDNKGGGVFVGQYHKITLSGAVKIIGNTVEDRTNNLYLRTEAIVTVESLEEGANIGVTTEAKPTEKSSVIIADNVASASYFSSDNSDYVTAIDENSKVVLKKKTAVEAPSITKQPQPVSVKVGETATFTVEAAGADLSYQWMVDKNDNRGFVDIAGATSESYTLNAISKEYSRYRYQCMVSNLSGHVISDCVTLTVTEDAAPTQNPVPNPEPKTFTYDGTEHTGIEVGENYKVIDGTNNATDAGTYKVTIKPYDGKTWEDGTTTEKQLEWIIKKASQNAPAGLVGEKTITAGVSDGKITGVNEQMEYRKSGDSSYIACTGTEITGLSAGTYEVRYKGDKNHEESPAFVVTVPDADKPVYILEIIDGTGNGTYVEGTVVTITANPAADGKVFDKWVKMYGDAVIADENSATTTVTTKIAPTTIKATYKDSETTPTPNPEPTPNPNPEPTPTPTPTPNPAPEATTPTPNPAPATSTPAASTTTAPASSAAAAPAQVTYDILDGAGSSWTQNTDGSLAIRGSGEISKFREVKVDGVTVDPVNYTVTEGSTIITFKPEYLKSLSAGNHSFELVWTDGTAATNFTVAENADQSAKSPKTGEDFSMALCTALLMVSCAGLAGMFVRRKRNHAR